jgi:hypothetical protein
MKGHGSKFGRKKEAAVLALLTQPTLEAAARAIGVAPNTLLRWQQDPEFDKAYKKTRRLVFGQGTARLQQASGAAVSTVLKIMVDPASAAATRLRAAEIVLDKAAKAIELEDIEARVAELERAAETKQKG